MVKIRQENTTDFAWVFQVNVAAFETDKEAKLVEKLRNVQPHISLVAEIEGIIVGHIFFSPIFFEDEETDFLGLAPLAVSPEFQNQGIGSKLVNEGLRIAAESGFTGVFVLGHPNYYPRFGFKVAKTQGFTCEYPVSDEHFMVLELKKDSLKGKRGLVKYSPEFAEF